jgi:beta-glucuronidase
MSRTLEKHLLRSVKSLEGQWTFAANPDDQGIALGWTVKLPTEAGKAYVPSCWNNDMGMYHYEGAAWYGTSFQLTSSGNIRLEFEGVLGQADIYVDGVKAGAHYGGFTSFEAVLPQLAAGSHELVVRTDNRHTKQTIPLDRVDWFHYGGIIRPFSCSCFRMCILRIAVLITIWM